MRVTCHHVCSRAADAVDLGAKVNDLIDLEERGPGAARVVAATVIFCERSSVAGRPDEDVFLVVLSTTSGPGERDR